ncbi:hypothetical protein HQ81_0166 [Dickeya phage phiDP23.1]|uniref:Uncharacterized protein n=17 Tax=Aglimvirinae TaxID=2169530 RepID=I0J366_9CAUD|nr:hypothetical protein G379_gp040 [Dickeya phage vB-DsoM-LIMEstone1]YP_009102993.1 hypothetical protein DA66_0154 [Dickeya phage RC-2014]AIM51408.1 hypothetical protein HQ80_0187 [Dickeya phage phiD3]AIM51595.1 hypothetical protein HQ82_0040 [Dickeya phage phiDP10.3]AIM51894.1 hypothetical protein HQ81_0166 [Dickeya phage phiDP23.1]ASD51377.1 hypothetical protein [Dickeya phage JA15]ASD51573.1 hypothetical protein [Dickeya phage XF4]ATW62193.1 hypothetical protein [Dickeya phage PP35]AYN55
MAMQRIEDVSLLDMEATFGDYFESTPKQKDPLVGRLVVSESFAEKVREGLPAEYSCFRNGAPVIIMGESK